MEKAKPYLRLARFEEPRVPHSLKAARPTLPCFLPVSFLASLFKVPFSCHTAECLVKVCFPNTAGEGGERNCVI